MSDRADDEGSPPRVLLETRAGSGVARCIRHRQSRLSHLRPGRAADGWHRRLANWPSTRSAASARCEFSERVVWPRQRPFGMGQVLQMPGILAVADCPVLWRFVNPAPLG